MTGICRHTQLELPSTNDRDAFVHIAASHDSRYLSDDFVETVWREVGSLAKRFGYSPSSREGSSHSAERRDPTKKVAAA